MDTAGEEISLEWMEKSFPSSGGGDKFERELEGKCRGKLRELLPDYPVLFPQANLAISSCSTSLESLFHPAQNPNQLQKMESQLD